ncbi:MAG TPA: hypothetical protein VIW78_08615 [Burkholderiales bacterium]
MKKIFAAAVIAGAASSAAVAQTNASNDPLATRGGWEAGGQIASYHYEEPNFAKLIGPRVGAVGAYTFVPGRMFIKADVRGSVGSLEYQGTGTQDSVPDYIFETRVVAGTDFRAGGSVAFSPYAGLGYRYLYDDLRGYTQVGNKTFAGYRRYSSYLYAPVGLTARFRIHDRWVLAPMVEYDYFIRGKQITKLSDAGSGFPDITNTQTSGYGYRLAVMAEKDRFAFGPWMNYWKIGDSDTVTVNSTTGLEPANWTREVGLEFRYRF